MRIRIKEWEQELIYFLALWTWQRLLDFGIYHRQSNGGGYTRASGGGRDRALVGLRSVGSIKHGRACHACGYNVIRYLLVLSSALPRSAT
jgi:hypothetical protein